MEKSQKQKLDDHLYELGKLVEKSENLKEQSEKNRRITFLEEFSELIYTVKMRCEEICLHKYDRLA